MAFFKNVFMSRIILSLIVMNGYTVFVTIVYCVFRCLSFWLAMCRSRANTAHRNLWLHGAAHRTRLQTYDCAPSGIRPRYPKTECFSLSLMQMLDTGSASRGCSTGRSSSSNVCTHSARCVGRGM
jgi:hypothetical protein